ncbi:MAG: hypothetical protein CVT47_02810 [Thermoplasmata archaeon HGW-Thermoplasmata-2]|nr:MAG: hypothetical protein CVT47_02810 [Thermoplasmata archaeon HGW-Thermoplasmata-2]
MGKCKECGIEIQDRYEYCINCNPSLKSKSETKFSENEKYKPHKIYYDENMIKGRIAEALIEQLFLSLEYSVFRYGMENTVPSVTKLIQGIQGEVADAIKMMPDFVIRPPKSERLFFVEVKFRKGGELHSDDEGRVKYLQKIYPQAYIILVSEKHIKSVQISDYVNKRKGGEFRYLAEQEDFDFPPEARDQIITFCRFASKFFSNV